MNRKFKLAVAMFLLGLMMVLPNTGAFALVYIDPGNLQIVETKPNVPTNLKANATSASVIELSWTDNSLNEDGFFIHRKVAGAPGYTTIVNLKPGVTSYQDTGLSSATKYYYVVTAFNSKGASDFSNEANAVTFNLEKPVAPTLLSAVPSSDTQIDIQWQNNCSTEKGFYIYRKAPGEMKFTMIDDTKSPQWTGYGDAGLKPGSNYAYYVSAYNEFGSADSNILTTSTTGTALLDAPSALTAKALSGITISLSWKDNSDNEDGFILERSLTQVKNYKTVADLDENCTSYDDKGLTPGTTYYYRIKAYNTETGSDYSALASAQTVAQAPPLPDPDNSTPTTPGSQNVVLKFYIDRSEYYINNSLTPMDSPPVIKENRTLLPIRFVTAPLGADLQWDAANKKVTITSARNNKVIQLWIGQNTALVNGVQKLIDPNNKQVVPMILPPGRTMLPLRFITENLNCDVDWNSSSKEIKVTYIAP